MYFDAYEAGKNFVENLQPEQLKKVQEQFVLSQSCEIPTSMYAVIGATILARNKGLKIYFRYPHFDKNIMLWAQGDSVAMKAVNLVVSTILANAKQRVFEGVATEEDIIIKSLFHQVGNHPDQEHTCTGWEFWVEYTDRNCEIVMEYITKICRMFGIEPDIMC